MVLRLEEALTISEEDRNCIRECASSAVQNASLADDYADACEYFYLFRKFHRETEQQPERAVLIGDYYFSRFSHALIPIDNVALTDRFAEYLKQDSVGLSAAFDLTQYLMFIRQTAMETKI